MSVAVYPPTNILDISALQGRATALETRATTMEAKYLSSRNIVINGAFDIWQRGTSFAGALASPYYGPDRWQTFRSSLATGGTWSRQLAGVGVPAYYCLRISRDSGNASTVYLGAFQSFETQRVAELRGELVTLSYWARAGANAVLTGFVPTVYYGTGTDGNIQTGFTGQTVAFASIPTLTTSWQLFTTTGVVPATATQLAVAMMYLSPIGTAGAADYIEITAVQLEHGQIATLFERQQISDTFAQCQRYFEFGVIYAVRENCDIARSVYETYSFKVSKRIVPTMANVNSSQLHVTVATIAAYDINIFTFGWQSSTVSDYINVASWTASAEL
jgi:hypothetical protein